MYRIYKITCTENGKVYIGYTKKAVDERFKNHIDNARWKRKTALCDAIRVYGNDKFSVELIMECESHAQACKHEARLIAELNSMLPNGYNMTRGGDGVPVPIEIMRAAGEKRRGLKTEKMLAYYERKRGVKQTVEHATKRALTQIGKKRSDETRRRMSESIKAVLACPEIRKKSWESRRVNMARATQSAETEMTL